MKIKALYLKSFLVLFVVAAVSMQTAKAQLFPAPNQNVKDAFSLASSLYSSHGKQQAFQNRLNKMVQVSSNTSDPQQLVRDYQYKLQEMQRESERRKREKEAELRRQIDLINKGVEQALKAADVDLGTYGNMLKNVATSTTKNVLVNKANKKIEALKLAAEKELEQEMSQAMGTIYKQIVQENKEAQKEYLYAAAEVFSEKEEQHYLSYYTYYNCMLSYMEKDYNYLSDDWLKTSCAPPPRTYFNSSGSVPQLNYTNYQSNQPATQVDFADFSPEGRMAAIDLKLEESVKKVDALLANTDDAFQRVEYLSLKQDLIDKAAEEKEAIQNGSAPATQAQPQGGQQAASLFQRPQQQYQPLLDVAKRKLALYKSSMPYPEFLESAKKYAEAELAENSRNANGYVFLADLSEEVSQKYLLTGYALYFDRNNAQINQQFTEAKDNFGKALYAAIDKNDVQFVRDAKNQNLLTGFQYKSQTPFEYAVTKDNAEVAELLMPSEVSRYNLLYYAIEKGGTKVAYKQMRAIDVNQVPTSNGHDLLTASLYFNRYEIAKELLHQNFNYKSSLSKTKYSDKELYHKLTWLVALYAVETENVAMLEAMLQNAPSIMTASREGETLVDVIVKGNKTKLFPVLTNYGLDLANGNYGHLIELAIQAEAESMALTLIEMGVDVNHRPQTGGSLVNLLAGKKDMNNLFETLLRKGVDVSAYDHNNELALTSAMKAGQLTKADKLLDYNCRKDLKSKTSGNQIQWLIDNGVDKAFIPILVEHQIAVNAQDARGNTPLLNVVENPVKKYYIETLLAQGADVDVVNDKGISPLQLAIYNKSAYVPQMLKQTTRPNKQGMNGWTALHFAAREGNYEAVSQLLRSQADPSITDHWGRTPYRISREYGYADIQKLLRKNMGLGKMMKSAYIFNKKKNV